MNTTTMPATSLADDVIEADPREGPRPVRWTREEYEGLAEAGVFDGRRVQLIEGEIVQMPAQNGPHVVSVELAGDAPKSVFGSGYFVRRQAPLNLSNGSAPEPDLAVVEGSPRDHLQNPVTALLVVEVSDATFAYDLRRKAPLYARAGIPEYWIIDLVRRRLLVHRQSLPDQGA